MEPLVEDHRQAVTIRTLRQFSENTRNKKVEVPPSVAYIFRVMIETRTRLGTYFKKNTNVDFDLLQNTSHEYFTDRFEPLSAPLVLLRLIDRYV
jgi:hypothetical protein